VNYAEADRVVADFKGLTEKAQAIYKKLPADKRDAYYQLVLFPTRASTLVNELYLAAAKNILYARQNRASTNDWAAETQRLFRADTSLMGYFNRDFAGGKWSHFMDQPHLGYVSWRDPPQNSLQHIALKIISVPEEADMGVAIEGSENAWPDSISAILPEFDVFNRQSRYIEIFNRGRSSFTFQITRDPWILLSEHTGDVEKDKKIDITVDWDKIPEGLNKGMIRIQGTGKTVQVEIQAFKPAGITPDNLQGFVEADCYVSMEAGHFTNRIAQGNNQWLPVEDFGHTLSGLRATTDCDSPPLIPGKNSPCLEYQMYLFSQGTVEVTPYTAPTLNFLPGRAVRYGISFDNEEPVIVTLVPEDFDARNGNREWERSVSDNYRMGKSSHVIDAPGYHTLKIWMIDPGVVLQKIVVNTGGVKRSYLGPPESYRGNIK
jgi:hypothetical protein